MFAHYQLAALAAISSYTYFVQAIPATSHPQSHGSASNVTLLRPNARRVQEVVKSNSPPVLYRWSNDPNCDSATTKANCTAAYASICHSGQLTESMKHTVEGCTAWYWVDPGNQIPTAAQCSTSYLEILGTDNGFGSLGYNEEETRTDAPLYAVYPADGNGKCFKAPGDTSPVQAMNAQLNGKGSLYDCGAAKTPRDLHEFNPRGVFKCLFEDVGWQAFCDYACISTVVVYSAVLGFLAYPLGLACLGGCDYSGYKVADRCMDEDEPEKPAGTKVKRLDPLTPADKCASIEKWTFQCPALEAAIRDEHGCETKT